MKHLNDEAVKTNFERQMEKRWTTFLQKPNRPVTKPKVGTMTDIIDSIPQSTQTADHNRELTEGECIQTEEVDSCRGDGGDEESREGIPDLMNCEIKHNLDGIENSSGETENIDGSVEKIDCSFHPVYQKKSNREHLYGKSSLDVKTQLIDIQNQLRELYSLPLTIQTAIKEITNQVSELFPEILLPYEEKRNDLIIETSINNIDELETQKFSNDVENEGEVELPDIVHFATEHDVDGNLAFEDEFETSLPMKCAEKSTEMRNRQAFDDNSSEIHDSSCLKDEQVNILIHSVH